MFSKQNKPVNRTVNRGSPSADAKESTDRISAMKKYLYQIKIEIFISLVLYGLEVIATSAILLLPGYLMDHYSDEKNMVLKLAGIYVLLFTLYLIICYFSNRIADLRRIKFEKNIKRDFFNSVIEKSYGDYHKYDIGEYLSMQANDITEMCQSYLSPLLSVFRSVFMIVVFGIALVAFVDVSIAIIIILFSACVVFIPKLTAKELSEKNAAFLNSVGEYTSKIKSFFEAHDILDECSTKKIEEIQECELKTVLKNNMNFRRVNSLAMVVNGGAVEFVSVVSFIVIAALLVTDKITIGMATAAFMYSTKFVDPIYELNVNIGKIKSTDQVKEKLACIIRRSDTDRLPKAAEISRIEVKGIRKSFKDVNIVIPDMEFVFPDKYLVTGENGVGKSVLFRILLGFYDADEGKILFDGKEKADVSRLINYVPQNPILFEASYKENITLFGTYDTEKLSLYESFFPPEMIEHIKMNFDSRNMSGGEKQTVVLLRSLCSNKKILLLDEPFAAMNQAAITRFMEHLKEIDRMVVIIAHNADNFHHVFSKVYRVAREE